MQTLHNHNIIVQYNYQHRLHHINAIIHASTQYTIIKETQICANTMATPQIYHATSTRTQHDARIVHQLQRKHKSSSGESHLQLKHNTSPVSITYLCFLSILYIDCTDNVNYTKYTKDYQYKLENTIHNVLREFAYHSSNITFVTNNQQPRYHSLSYNVA